MHRDSLNNISHRRLSAGVTIVEALFGIAIFGLAMVGVTHALTLFADARAEALDNTKELYLAEEGIEVLRFIRDANWETIDDLAVDTVFYLSVSTTTLATTTAPELIEGTYARNFVLKDVYRNADDDIVASTTGGAVIATGTVSVKMNVSRDGVSTTSLQALMTNIFGI